MPTCALCEVDVDELRDSHILPKWLYKRVRDQSGEAQPPDPVHMTQGGAIQTSRQLRARLLCARCEHRLNACGERYVSRVAYQPNGDCPLYAELGRRCTTEATASSIECVRADNLDVDKLVHFASGVFWRASVSGKVPKGRLPASVQEALRSYLLGTDRFPPEFALLMYVLDQPRGAETRHHTYFASPHGNDNGSFYEFAAVGLYFALFVDHGTEEHRAASLPISRTFGWCTAASFPYTARLLEIVADSVPKP